MEPVYLQCQLCGHLVLGRVAYSPSRSAILSDEETASELSAPTSITLFGPLDDDVSDVIKAMAIFEAEVAPDAVAIS